ncbi:MAG: MlaD family protein [Candidatus Comchoanobacterales bacterium]
MSSEQLKNLMIGLFIIVSLAAMMFVSYSITTQEPILNSRHYSLYAEFDDVAGLVPLNPVRISGVLVGRVKAISLNQETQKARVEFAIHDPELKVPKGSSLSIATEGLLGQKYLEFKLSDQKEYLKHGDTVVKTTSVKGLEESLSSALDHAGTLIRQTLGVPDEDNDGSLREFYFTREQIPSSLIEGSMVLYKGLAVGEISSIELTDEPTEDCEEDSNGNCITNKYIKVQMNIFNGLVDIKSCTKIEIKPELILGKASLEVINSEGCLRKEEQLSSGSLLKEEQIKALNPIMEVTKGLDLTSIFKSIGGGGKQ